MFFEVRVEYYISVYDKYFALSSLVHLHAGLYGSVWSFGLRNERSTVLIRECSYGWRSYLWIYFWFFSTEHLNAGIMFSVCLLGFLIIFKAYMNSCLGKLAHTILCLWIHLNLSYTMLRNHSSWRASLPFWMIMHLIICAHVCT